MTTRARATIPLLFLLAIGLLFAAAVGTSREEEGRRGEHWLRQCEQRCQKDRPRYQRSQCEQECRQEQKRWEQEQEQEQGRGHRGDREREGQEQKPWEKEQGRGRRGEQDREGEQQESRRPYVFGPRSFQHIVRSDQGFIKALRPFNEESRLLRGIKNYRVAILEANPRSFVVPGYTDADGIGYP